MAHAMAPPHSRLGHPRRSSGRSRSICGHGHASRASTRHPGTCSANGLASRGRPHPPAPWRAGHAAASVVRPGVGPKRPHRCAQQPDASAATAVLFTEHGLVPRHRCLVPHGVVVRYTFLLQPLLHTPHCSRRRFFARSYAHRFHPNTHIRLASPSQQRASLPTPHQKSPLCQSPST